MITAKYSLFRKPERPWGARESDPKTLSCCVVRACPCGSHYNLKDSVTSLRSCSAVNLKAQRRVIKYLFPSFSDQVSPSMEADVKFLKLARQADVASFVHFVDPTQIKASHTE